MSHGKDAARDLRYGRRGGGWAADTDERSIAEIKADHLAAGPCGRPCLWCDELGESPPPSLFDDDQEVGSVRVARAVLLVSVLTAAVFVAGLSGFWQTRPPHDPPVPAGSGDASPGEDTRVGVPSPETGGGELARVRGELSARHHPPSTTEPPATTVPTTEAPPVTVGQLPPGDEPRTSSTWIEREPTTDLEALICSYGWDCATALRVAHCESTMNPGAVGGAGERGLFQLHPVHAARFGERWELMFDPEVNIAAAHQLWSEQGWSPWTCAR